MQLAHVPAGIESELYQQFGLLACMTFAAMPQSSTSARRRGIRMAPLSRPVHVRLPRLGALIKRTGLASSQTISGGFSVERRPNACQPSFSEEPRRIARSFRGRTAEGRGFLHAIKKIGKSTSNTGAQFTKSISFIIVRESVASSLLFRNSSDCRDLQCLSTTSILRRSCRSFLEKQLRHLCGWHCFFFRNRHSHFFGHTKELTGWAFLLDVMGHPVVAEQPHIATWKRRHAILGSLAAACEAAGIYWRRQSVASELLAGFSVSSAAVFDAD